MKAGLLLGLLAAGVASATAGEREDYLLRGAQRDMGWFRQFDADRDGKLTRTEVQGMVSLQARFDDMDANRDGEISLAEMSRYLRLSYEVIVVDGAPRLP